MVEKLFEKFFEASRQAADKDEKLKYAVIDKETGITILCRRSNAFYVKKPHRSSCILR